MKKLFAIMFILSLNSCSLFEENGIEIKIKNNSGEPITDVEFTTSERIELIKINSIKPNESVSEFLSMRNNKSDGSYSLSFTRDDGKREVRNVGYYTNGGSLDQWVEFSVENDSTIVKFSQAIY